jgi:L-lactate dehydrogenase complex protein LldG
VDREPFLSRVSAAVMAAMLPSGPSASGWTPDLDPVDLVALFRARAQEASTVVHGPVGAHGAVRSITGIAAGHGSKSFMAWDDLPASGVVEALSASGLARVDDLVPGEGRRAHQLGYVDLDLGVTSSIGGLAESGSVILSHGAGRSRMASLVPEVHIALVAVSAIDRTVAQWAARHPATVAETSNLVIVTGPSRTADIELQLNLGVHGARHLHVVLIK